MQREIPGRRTADRGPHEAVGHAEQAIGSNSCQMGTSGSITWLSQNSATEQQSRPKLARYRGWVRSVSLPTHGDSAPVMTAIGTSSSADFVGLRPRTDWA